MPKGAGYTWRVLQGGERLQHDIDCVFFRESRNQRAEKNWLRAARVPPEGYFAVLHAREKGNGLTVPVHELEEGGDREPGQRQVPALSQLLHQLMQKAGLTRMQANEPDRDVNEWMRAIRDAAKEIEVAPGRSLDRLLFLSRVDWDRRRVHARVREAARDFPNSHVPQGFVCFPVYEIGDRCVPIWKEYAALEAVSQIMRPTIGGHAVPSPYLFFGVVALTTRRRGYECVQAWAQPIVSFRRPVPVDSSFERRVFGTLRTTLKVLDGAFPDAAFEIEKPVFDMVTRRGPCLPDFLICGQRNDDRRTFVVEVMGFDRPTYLAGKKVTHERMEDLGPVILMDGKEFKARLTDEGRDVTRLIRADLERMWHLQGRKDR